MHGLNTVIKIFLLIFERYDRFGTGAKAKCCFVRTHLPYGEEFSLLLLTQDALSCCGDAVLWGPRNVFSFRVYILELARGGRNINQTSYQVVANAVERKKNGMTGIQLPFQMGRSDSLGRGDISAEI